MGRLSPVVHFLLEPGCEVYSFLHYTVKDIEHGLDPIITASIDTPELDASFDQADTIPSFSFFKASTLTPFLIFLKYSLPVASNLINCSGRVGLSNYLSHSQVKC